MGRGNGEKIEKIKETDEGEYGDSRIGLGGLVVPLILLGQICWVTKFEGNEEELVEGMKDVEEECPSGRQDSENIYIEKRVGRSGVGITRYLLVGVHRPSSWERLGRIGCE